MFAHHLFSLHFDGKNKCILPYEIILKFKEKSVNLDHLLGENLASKITILAAEGDAAELLVYLIEHPSSNIKAAIPVSAETAKLYRDSKIPFFFSSVAHTWEEIYSYAEMGVSDIAVGGDLCFELDKVAAYLHPRNISVRVTVDYADRGAYNIIPSAQAFFIRPEDIHLYEPFVDIFDIQSDKEAVIRAYKSGHWYGNIQEIIPNLDCAIDTKYLMRDFAKRRVKCGRRCLKGSSCNICNSAIELSGSLKDNDYIILPSIKKNN